MNRAAAATLLLCAIAPLAARAQSDKPRAKTFDLLELKVVGVHHLSDVEVEAVLTPFLGPGKVLDDVEKARVALEKAYSDKGYQGVAVAIPPQTVRDGMVTLKVTEGTVGRLRVHGARYFLPSEVRRLAPSVAEGSVPNFNDVLRDIIALNQLPDRRVSPALRPGQRPGTIDVDLNVQDRLPLHGSLELNNRYTSATTVPRLNASLRYDNLWQLGHSLSFSAQIAPERLRDAKVWSGSYLARFADAPWLTLSLNAIIQDSDISTLGGTAVQGRGRIFGGRAAFTLPSSATYFHTLTAGLDYKRFGKELPDDPFAMPVRYWPLSAQYAGNWNHESWQMRLAATAQMNVRGFSSTGDTFDARRFKASGSFTTLRLELQRIQELPWGFQASGRVQGQLSPDPLIPSEQLTAGGVDTVRGYLEAQVAGDSGGAVGVELRSPAAGSPSSWLNELRGHVFADGARLTIRDRLPEQKFVFILWSAGAGLRLRAFDVFNAAADLGVPLRSEGVTTAFHPRLHFRLWTEI